MSKFAVEVVYYGVQLQTFVNVDDTAVFFEAIPNAMAHHVGANTISLRSSGSKIKRLKGCVPVCRYETKLPLFVIFEGEPNGPIEKLSMHSYRAKFMVAVSQKAGWTKVSKYGLKTF